MHEDQLWVARDRGGYLYMYTRRPQRFPDREEWDLPRDELGDYDGENYLLPPHWLPDLTWEDDARTVRFTIDTVAGSEKRTEARGQTDIYDFL